MNALRSYLPAVLGLAGLLAIAAFTANRGGGEAVSSSPTSARETAASRKSAAREPAGTSSSHLVGLTLSGAGNAGAWATALSRNEHEHAQRLADVKHLKKAEVIEFNTIAENAGRLSTDRLPLRLSLPSFGGGTVEVEFDHLSIDGPAGGTLAGKVIGEPKTSVVLGFHNGETSGVIEGPGKIVFLDAFDQEVAILRELDAEAHAKDFQCDCMLHRARREQDHPEPQEPGD